MDRGPASSSRLVFCAAGLIALISGCSGLREWKDNGFKVGPRVCVAAGNTAASWIDQDDERVRESASVPDEWWKQFDDPKLNELIADAMSQNLTLQEAGFRVLAARAQLARAKGNLFPQRQELTGGYQRIAASQESNDAAGFTKQFFDQYAVGFNASWEADFWGRIRRSISAAENLVDASAADYGFVMVTLQADVAANYIQVRTLQQRIEYLHANIDLQEQNLRIARDRYKNGRTGPLDFHQAQAQLTDTDAQLPRLYADLRRSTNRLCVLLGIPPTELEEELGIGPIPVAPESVHVGIPADLLRRRPDVIAAERRAYAQGEKIGIAEAELYPRFTISGSIGYRSQSMSELFISSATEGNIGPGFDWKILNYGRLRNKVREEEAKFNELVNTYQQSVLKANAEVENGLAAFVLSHKQAEHLKESVNSSQKASEVVQKAYRLGVNELDGKPFEFNRLTTIQQDLVTRQDMRARAIGNIALSLVEVYRALGGGWQCQPAIAAELSPLTPVEEEVAPEPPLEPAPVPPEPDAVETASMILD